MVISGGILGARRRPTFEAARAHGQGIGHTLLALVVEEMECD